MTEGPKRTDKPAESVDLTGKLLAWTIGQPEFLQMPGSPFFYIACFTTEEKLRALWSRVDLDFERIKRIDDGPEFLLSIYTSPKAAEHIKVIVDPFFLPNGRMRYVEVQLPGAVLLPDASDVSRVENFRGYEPDDD